MNYLLSAAFTNETTANKIQVRLARVDSDMFRWCLVAVTELYAIEVRVS